MVGLSLSMTADLECQSNASTTSLFGVDVDNRWHRWLWLVASMALRRSLHGATLQVLQESCSHGTRSLVPSNSVSLWWIQ